jgi:hypothetical protein
MYVCRNEIVCVFGTDDFMTSRSYTFRRDDGLVSFYALLRTEHSRHPDLNEDGTFKRSRLLLFPWRTACAHSESLDESTREL